MRITYHSLLAAVVLATISASSFGASIIDVQSLPSLASSHSGLVQTLQLNPQTSFIAGHAVTTNGNHFNYRLQQYYRKIPIYGFSIVATKDAYGHYIKATGLAVNNIAQDIQSITPEVSANQATQIALNSFQKLAHSTPVYSHHQSSNLWIYLTEKHRAKLVYITTFLSLKPQFSEHKAIIDAHTGSIIKQWDNTHRFIPINSNSYTNQKKQKTAGFSHISTFKLSDTPSKVLQIGTGDGGNEKTGKYHYGQENKPFLNITQNGSDCTLENSQEKTLNLHNKNSDDSQGSPITYPCPEYTEATTNGAYNVANDAHFAADSTVNMFKQWLNIDLNNNTQFKVIVHCDVDYNNAFMNDANSIALGDGDNKIYYPWTSLDIVGGTIGYIFTDNHSKLAWDGSQSAAISASFTQITGVAVKNFVTGNDDFTLGNNIIRDEKSFRTAIFYLDDPTKDGSSIDSATKFSPDNFPQSNAGVFNKAFYTLATTNNWNIKKAFQVFATANELYWNTSSNFKDGACGVVKAAKDLNLPQEDVINAFSQVDINNPCG
ncbi:M4 family metallopeptidase [Parashewanella tropica]|uniref:M4 family metallopeptidase n=1 Tax=Parashewanella tropica TaxID=2547970 RepID=UPI00147871EF|nr:M4 family metallopeptidase [Parashewanella tropica]